MKSLSIFILLVTTAYARRTRGAAYNYQPPNGNAINFENFQKTNQAEGFGQQQLPQQGLEPPQFAQGLPQIPQGLSQFPQGLPQFPQGLQPGLPQFPQGLQPGLPQFQQGLPQRVFQLPQGLPQIPQGIPQGLPQIPQGLPPQFPQGLPQRLPQIPQGLPQFPQNLPQLPQGLPQPPQGLIQLPQNVQPLPQNIPQLPQSLPKEFLQGLPQNLPQFPSPPELPKELPPQLPQNLPQGFPQDFPQFQQNLPQELPKVNVQIQEQVVSQQRLPLPANFNFGGLPQQQEVKIGGSPAPQVSFPPPPQFPEAAPQPAAQIPESFPSQINLNQGEAQFPTVPQQEAGGVLVTKHVYFHVAPEAPEEYSAPRNIPIAPVRRHYKIIFIKAPYGPSPTTPSIPVQPQDEEKTLVYVLVRKPEQQPEIVVPTPVPTQPSKPEVYFIRYKAAKDNNGPAPTAPLEENFNGYPIAEDVLKKGDGQPGILTQQQFDQIPQNIEQPISSGESSSVSFSRENEPASQYGPPAYKKKK